MFIWGPSKEQSSIMALDKYGDAGGIGGLVSLGRTRIALAGSMLVRLKCLFSKTWEGWRRTGDILSSGALYSWVFLFFFFFFWCQDIQLNKDRTVLLSPHLGYGIRSTFTGCRDEELNSFSPRQWFAGSSRQKASVSSFEDDSGTNSPTPEELMNDFASLCRRWSKKTEWWHRSTFSTIVPRV